MAGTPPNALSSGSIGAPGAPAQRAGTLLERESELSRLTEALTLGQRERGQLLLIEGPAGMGKTSLLRAGLEMAAGLGFTCLRARSTELERDFPYGCVRQLLEPVVLRASRAERERLFEGAAAFAEPVFALAVPQPMPAADSSLAILHGLYWLLNNLARELPVALGVDDLHWSDRDSLRFLNYLAPRLDGMSLVVLGSMRARESIPNDLARLCEGPETTVLRLGPLSVPGCAALCERRLGEPASEEFVAACHGATAGNPLFLELLLRESKAAAGAREAVPIGRFGPAAVARTVLLRLSTAPREATELVRAVAVLGDGTRVTEAARFAEIGDEAAARAADLLVSLAILKQADGLEFNHPIVRQAVYADAGFHERARAHARAARILSECGASEERVATQIAQAEPAGDAARVGLLRRVAADALARGAPGAAVVWLQRALSEPPPPGTRAEVLLELGTAELRLAAPRAVEHLSAVARDMRPLALRAYAVRQLANALAWTGNTDGAVAALESAIPAIEAEDRELALIVEAEFAAKAQQAGREARARAAQRLERHAGVEGVTPGERLVLASLAFERARASESASDAVRHIEPALASGGLSGAGQPDVVGPFYALVIGLLATDALDLAIGHLERALAEARARAAIPAIAFLMAHRGWFCLRAGAVAEAEADARAALDLLGAHDIQLGRRFALALLTQALIENDQLAAAEHELESSGLAVEIPPALANDGLLEARGALRIARGDVRAGLADLLEFGRRDEGGGAAHPLASRWRSRACLALAATGDTDGARQMAQEELERARRWGTASGMGRALRAVALLVEDGTSLERLREAADVSGRSPARLEHARVLTDLGAALRRTHHRAEARNVLSDALALARRCGAGGLVERAGTELRAAGGRSGDAITVGVARLTVTERRVAELAARGHSNPSIAQTLFVTRKTVETHLGHIYAKLGVSGRAELGRALSAEAPPAAP